MSRRTHHDNRLSRRRFTKLAFFGSMTACAPPRRTMSDHSPEPRSALGESGWSPEQARSSSFSESVAQRFVEQAKRTDWRHDPVAAPDELKDRQLLTLGPQRALAAHVDGLVVVSDAGRVGHVDARCREYRQLAEGIARISSVGTAEVVAAVDEHQRARLIDVDRPSTVPLSKPDLFEEAASQAWAFSDFALVAHCGLPPTHHDPGPSAGLVIYALDRRGDAVGDVRLLASDRHFDARFRALPTAEGLIVAQNFMGGGNKVSWNDWKLRPTAKWLDEEGRLDHLAPVVMNSVVGDFTAGETGGHKLEIGDDGRTLAVREYFLQREIMRLGPGPDRRAEANGEGQRGGALDETGLELEWLVAGHGR